jgi:2-iminobutanoate/2-iminopropanoate deaminase
MRSLSSRLPAGFAVFALLALSCSAPVNVEVEAPKPEKSRLNGRIPPVGPYSAGVAFGDVVFLAGQIALNHEGGGLVEGGITEQTHQVMQNLQAVLEEAGLGFGNVVRTGVFLADVNDFGAMNEVYASYFPEGAIPPARTTVAVAGIPLGALLEIDMIAVRE